MQKSFPNGAEIDAKTHKKSMPKLVSKKIREIINNHVSLKGKTFKIHLKNKCFLCFRKLHVWTVKVSQKHQKWDQNPSNNRWTIDTNFIFEKVMHQLQKIIQNGAQKGANNYQSIYQKRIRKKIGKRWSGPPQPGRPSAPVRLLKINKIH